MKVARLIDKLRRMPPDASVETEGCDCIGQAEGVKLDGDTVLITRTMGDEDRARLLSRRNFKAEYDDDVVEDVEIEEAIK